MRAAGADPTEWVVVIPVKRLDRAKTRLATRPARQRGALALAFTLDTVRAALRVQQGALHAAVVG